METLLSCLRQRVAGMGSLGCIGAHGSPSYLEWMISTVEGNPLWPKDKRVRWLGFVAGGADFATFGRDGGSVARMTAIDCQALSCVNPQFERVLFSGLDEVLEGLEAVCEEKAADTGVQLAEAARRSPTAAKASFCLGYLQAYMTGWNILDVDAERDRTRPIFHRVYAACGYDIPETTSKPSA